jgi:lipopolysaccharide transport system ATP-binding protein
MQLRLAFSVAAFLEPEILVIDEVLAVGDAEFQKKCLGKMEDVSKSGRTILFVSHNLAAVRTLCTHSVILQKGEVDFVGNTTDAITKYLLTNQGEGGSNGAFDLAVHKNKKKPGHGIIKSRLLKNGIVTDVFFSQDKFTAEFEFVDTNPVSEIVFGIVIKDYNQQPVMGINNWDLGVRLNKQPVTRGRIIFEIESLPLYGDSFYHIDLYFGDGGNNYDTIENAMSFKLQTIDVFSNGKTLNPKLNLMHPGKVKMKLDDDYG